MAKPVRESAAKIDLDSIRCVYSHRSWGSIFSIAFCAIWGSSWIFFNYFVKADGEPPSRVAQYVIGLAGPLVLGVAFFLFKFYLNDRYVIEGGELIRIGAFNNVRFRTPLTAITAVKISEPTLFGEDGWYCWVEYGGSKSFQIGNTLKDYREFAALLKQISDQNWRTSRENAPWISDPLA